MLTRDDIGSLLYSLEVGATKTAGTGPKEQEQLALIKIGLTLLGNFLGDISDIALNNRRQHEDYIAYKAKMAIEEANRG